MSEGIKAASTSALSGLGPGHGAAGKKQVMMKAMRPNTERQRKKPTQPP